MNILSKDKTNIFNLDYRLLLTNTFINAMKEKPSILFFFDKNFPNHEKLRLLPHYDDYVNAIL